MFQPPPKDYGTKGFFQNGMEGGCCEATFGQHVWSCDSWSTFFLLPNICMLQIFWYLFCYPKQQGFASKKLEAENPTVRCCMWQEVQLKIPSAWHSGCCRTMDPLSAHWPHISMSSTMVIIESGTHVWGSSLRHQKASLREDYFSNFQWYKI